MFETFRQCQLSTGDSLHSSRHTPLVNASSPDPYVRLGQALSSNPDEIVREEAPQSCSFAKDQSRATTIDEYRRLPPTHATPEIPSFFPTK